jgi:hypothetical protein
MIRGVTKRLRASIAVVLLCVLTPTFASGCFGTFQLTKKVYKFNRTISYDKWIRWITFLVFCVVPVYGVSLAVDALFANSVEFWSGSNPITARVGETRVVYGPNGEVARATRLSDRAVRLEITDASGIEHTVTIVREAASVAALSAEGAVLARVTDVNGRPGLVTPPLDRVH